MLVTTSLGQVGDEFQDKTKYPDIVAPSKDPAIQKLYERLKLFDCVSGSDFGTTYDSADTGAVINFQKINGLNTTGEVHADTWKALSLTTWGTMSGGATSSKKCPAPTQTNNTSVTPSNADPTQASEDYYTNVSSFDGSSASTKFSNTTTGSISIVFNYLLTLMAVAIVVLVIFRVLQGAVIKGTFDNIYNQMKGKSMISNAGKALLVFIIVYAILAFINPDLVNWTMDTSYKADLSKSPYNNTNGSCPTDPYGEKSLREMIIFNEGKTNYVFLDTATPPLPSIGVGFNLKRNGAKESLIKAGVSEVKATQLVNATKEDKSLTLDDATIYKLLDEDIQNKKEEAITYFNKDGVDFNSLPINVQNVIVDMLYNVGLGSFSKFKTLKEAIKSKNWAAAAAAIINSQYCNDVGGRCYRNAALMSPGCGGALNNTNTSGQSLVSSTKCANIAPLTPVVYIRQCDYANVLYATNSNYPLKGNNYCSSGCGPTSAAMVVNTLKGKNLTPVDIGNEVIKNGGRIMGSGSSSYGIAKTLKQYGLNAEVTTDWNRVVSFLSKNTNNTNFLVIARLGNKDGNAYFTGVGHFEVLWKIENGKAYLNNPGSCTKATRDVQGVDANLVKTNAKDYILIN